MAKGKKSGGRPKGSLNKTTIELKEMIRAALDDSGGKEYFIKQAKENPTAFMTLIGKIIPSDVNATINGNVRVDGNIKFIRPGN